MVNVSNEGAPFSALPVTSLIRHTNAALIDEPEYPYVVKADVGRLSDGSIGLRLTLAVDEEAFQSKAWTQVAYLLGPATAHELATNLVGR